MFWGLILEPERRYTQIVKKPFHISMAALDVGSSSKKPSQVMCTYEGRHYLLCTLREPDMLQCPLDLEFAEGTEISFASNGNAHIHLTGYLTDVDNEGLFGDLADEGEEEEDDVEEQLEEEEETKSKAKKRKKKDGLEKPSKKSKLLNGNVKLEDAEEEESDDPDFEEAESEDVSEEDSDGDEEVEEEDGEEDNDEEEQEAEDEEEQPVQQKLSKKEKKKLKQEAMKKLEESKPQKAQKQNLKGGVIVEDLQEGSGPPAKAGRFITVYYEGRLQKNNKMFDSTTKGPGFKFRLGVGEVIKGWDTGIIGMKVGGVRRITCPPQTAYGPKGSPPAIPPNSTLVFTVTLKKVN